MSAQRLRLASLLVAVATVSSCSSSTRLPPPFVFNNPGDVELVCFDTFERKDESGRKVQHGDVPLPFKCCAGGQDEDVCKKVDGTDRKAVRHALVTQVSRGEVAAVNLVNATVLDSEARVPGFTFVDVGGLPSAIVVPPSMPGDTESGPIWTYVAGREVGSIRAVATCRFLLGRPCGPELPGNADPESGTSQEVRDRFRQQTELLLPEPPSDMLLDPAGDALWVTLPKAGLIARVRLGTTDRLRLVAPEEGQVAPFAFADSDDEATLMPVLAEPTYFKVPDGIVAEPPEPATEAESYFAACGLGYDYPPVPPVVPDAGAEGDPDAGAEGAPDASAPRSALAELDRQLGLLLPRAPRAASSGVATPTRMRLLPRDPAGADTDTDVDTDAAEDLLFVVDQGQLVMHVFALANGGLVDRGALPVGAPLRDFAITASVPATAPEPGGVLNPPDVVPASKRYVYAIDDRDGSVMAFDLMLEDGVPSLQPLLAPMPARDSLRMDRNYSDRILFNGAETPARALDIVDTRYAANLRYRERVECTDEDAVPTTLRGVFLIVAASDGRVNVLDVLDLNLGCRESDACVESPASDAVPLAIRRHAQRLESVRGGQASVASVESLPGPVGGCPESFGLLGNVCVPEDPWRRRDGDWTATYQGAVVEIRESVLEKPESELEEDAQGRLVLRAPEGISLCQRGLLAQQFQVAILSAPDVLPVGCVQPTSQTAPRLDVVEAHDDRLVLASDDQAIIDELVRCYPGLANATVFVKDAYFVSNGPIYLHRVYADESGACQERDADRLDTRFTSRAMPGELFHDPAVAFTLPSAQAGSALVSVTQTSPALSRSNVDTSSGRSDALPRRVRFFPETSELFIVDAASQGLKRYELAPFGPDSSRFR